MSKIISFPTKPFSLPLRGTAHVVRYLPVVELIEDSFFLSEEEIRYLSALEYLNRLMDDLAAKL